MPESEAEQDQSYCKATGETKKCKWADNGISRNAYSNEDPKKLYKIGFFPFSMKVG